MLNITLYDVAIIGAGPAGMTAALNLLRSKRKILIFEKENIGGQAAKSPYIENFPTIKKINGVNFANNFLTQINNFNSDIEFNLNEVLQINKINNFFEILTLTKKYYAKSVIIASGVKNRKFNISNEDKFLGHGISFCAVCDGFLYKNKNVCLIGDGNTALQYALLLANYCSNVFLYTISDNFFADEILIDRVKKKKKIFIRHNLVLKEIIGNKKLEKLIFLNKKTNKKEELIIDGLFIAIGKIADNKRFEKLVDLDNNNFIIVNNKMETKTSGLYAIGDCIKKDVKQISTAIGDGSIAAFFVNNYLNFL